MPIKRTIPSFLAGHLTPEAYGRWLSRKATAHVRRDRARGRPANIALYKDAIHEAVLASNGCDAYTGEELDWHLVSTYDNVESREGRHGYKAKFALLPTVDHLDAGANEASFRICAWRTNDSKHDLSVAEFVALCRRVVDFANSAGGPAPAVLASVEQEVRRINPDTHHKA